MVSCKGCQARCIKAGRQASGKQKWFCKRCKKYQQGSYQYRACYPNTNDGIIILTKNGVGIRGIARVLGISPNTVISRILKIAAKARPRKPGQTAKIQIDEMWTYVQSRASHAWLCYALDPLSKNILAFKVGARNKENLQYVVDRSLLHNPKHLCTDGLNLYQTIIPPEKHKIGLRHTRHIERMNLTLRNHLKRLGRKTINFSKSIAMLEAVLKIYFWARPQISYIM